MPEGIGEVRACDECADNAIKVMVGAIVGGALIPAHINWAIVIGAMSTGVVAIALCYGQKLSKDEAWSLIKEFIIAAGASYIALIFGNKVFSAILSSTGIGHVAAVALDGTISGAIAFAVGKVAKEYFRRGYLGAKRPSRQEMKAIFREAFSKKKSELKRPGSEGSKT